MKQEFNCPLGWHLWDNEKPIPHELFVFMRVRKNGVASVFITSLSQADIDKFSASEWPPIIWTYEGEFARNLLSMIQAPMND